MVKVTRRDIRHRCSQDQRCNVVTLARVNLVGHVAVAARQTADASPAYLVGAMLPDLAAMTRVRLGPPVPPFPASTDLSAGIALHHLSDAAFHGSRWFNEHNRALRDALLDAGVDPGAARASAHAGLEMLLDGELMSDRRVASDAAVAF